MTALLVVTLALLNEPLSPPTRMGKPGVVEVGIEQLDAGGGGGGDLEFGGGADEALVPGGE